MNQSLSALLGIKSAAATPETATANPALADATDTPHSFANVLTDTLSELGAPDTATQALLSAVAAFFPTSAPANAITDGAAAATTADDGGKHSPESGNSLPQLVLVTDSTDTLAQQLTTGLGTPADLAMAVSLSDPTQHPADATDPLAPQSSSPDAAPNLPAAGLVSVDVAAQLALPVAANNAQLFTDADVSATAPVAVEYISALAPAGIRTTGASSVNPTVSTFNTYNAATIAQATPALTPTTQTQGAPQDQAAPQKHASRDLDLLSSLAAVLVPLKERGAEQFQLAVPATVTALLPDSANFNASASPLTSSASLVPSVAATSITTSGKAEFAIPQAPGQPGWSDVFADRVTFAVKQSLQEAEIRLNPPQLGQVDVRIVMSNDQANLMFSSPHGAVREAIEASMGRLRDMLADSGFNLVNVDVSDRSLAQQRNDAQGQRESGRGGAQSGYRAEFELATHAPDVLRVSGTGSIDYFV